MFVILSEAKDLCTLPSVSMAQARLHRSVVAKNAAQDDKTDMIRVDPRKSVARKFRSNPL